jgi:hypothetical protein
MFEFPGCLLIVTAEVDAAIEVEWRPRLSSRAVRHIAV